MHSSLYQPELDGLPEAARRSTAVSIAGPSRPSRVSKAQARESKRRARRMASLALSDLVLHVFNDEEPEDDGKLLDIVSPEDITM